MFNWGATSRPKKDEPSRPTGLLTGFRPIRWTIIYGLKISFLIKQYEWVRNIKYLGMQFEELTAML